MCFSATASFSAAAGLSGLGVLTMKSARSRQELPFAAIPFLFAVQQLIEGVLWTSFHGDAPGLTRAMTLAYLFFSHVLWPVFVPVAVMLIEPSSSRRRDLFILVGAGVAVSAWLAYQTLTHGVESHPEGRHIEYALPLALGVGTTVLYVLSTVASLVLSSHRTVRVFGALTLLAFVVTYAFYSHWWVSVWCFFAALLSAVVLLHFRLAPNALREAGTGA
jgi:hypothetical protein